ncbi:hypothetical protein GQ607_008491 [Colletotrichum asianum]|uniref:Uncharacterized protein n=1 Tax=Colletotrichum asianum TaxID=702518 RepID=A0A8H3WGS2_9PEZI|nr:hypothetical protein GQ607_008491 [Colletotrichum asianum]
MEFEGIEVKDKDGYKDNDDKKDSETDDGKDDDEMRAVNYRRVMTLRLISDLFHQKSKTPDPFQDIVPINVATDTLPSPETSATPWLPKPEAECSGAIPSVS